MSQHEMHTRQRTCCRYVDPANFRMRVRAADEARVKRAREPDVVDEMALAPEQRRVFGPFDGRAEPFRAIGLVRLDRHARLLCWRLQ